MDIASDWRRAMPVYVVAALAALTVPFAARAQTPAAPAPTAPAPAVSLFNQATFPNKQRPPGDPVAIARGQALFGINCKACHGGDLRGGDLGGPNLLRSQLVLADQDGEAITPVVQNGRPASQGGPPMPPFALPPADVQAIVAYIHSVAGRKQNQGGPPPIPERPLDILVGDAGRGEQYFATHCRSCHAADGDLKGIASRAANPPALQDSWVAGRRPGPAVAGGAPRTQVQVTLETGATLAGTLRHLDDFTVSLTTADGRYHSFARQGTQGVRAVELHDPLQGHRDLLTRYSDQDMHDVTAYLATLK